MSCEHKSLLCFYPERFASSGFNVTAVSGISSIDNPQGMADQRLSNFTTIIPSANQFTFRVTFVGGFSKNDESLTLGLIGCNFIDEFGFNVDTTATVEINTSGFFIGNPSGTSKLKTFRQSFTNFADGFSPQEHRIISGGSQNVVAHGFSPTERGALNPDIYITISKDSGTTAAPFRVGYFFVGREIPISINPDSFQWRTRIVNERFTSRGLSVVSSDGVIQRSVAMDVRDIPLDFLFGQRVALNPDPEDDIPNWMRVIMANVGQPMLFSPYPYPIIDNATPTNEDLLLSLKQNFFIIYGLANQDISFNQVEGPGLNARYQTRMEFSEVR